MGNTAAVGFEVPRSEITISIVFRYYDSYMVGFCSVYPELPIVAALTINCVNLGWRKRDLSLTQAKVSEVIKKLLLGKAPCCGVVLADTHTHKQNYLTWSSPFCSTRISWWYYPLRYNTHPRSIVNWIDKTLHQNRFSQWLHNILQMALITIILEHSVFRCLHVASASLAGKRFKSNCGVTKFKKQFSTDWP